MGDEVMAVSSSKTPGPVRDGTKPHRRASSRRRCLSNDVKHLRTIHGRMTQQELADLVGVTRMTIYSLEKGALVPSTVIALRIAQVFGVAVEEVFHLRDA